MIFSSVRKGATATPALSLRSSAGWSIGGDSTQVALKISTVSACMELISNSIAMMPAYIVEESTKRRLVQHPLGFVLWTRANEVMSPFELMQKVVADVLAHGNGYVWNYRDKAGRVIERLPIPHDMCEPVYDAGREKWWYLATDPKTGQPYTLDPADISHYKAWTLDGLRGISVLERARRTIETAGNMEQYADSLYQNGGRPSGVLTVDTDLGVGTVNVKTADGSTETISKKEYIRREWDGNYAGPGKAFRTAVLDLGLKYQPISMSNSDAQFVEQKSVSAEDVCRFFCVPPYKVGLGSQSYNSNEQNNIEFVTQTLLPLVTKIEQEDTWKLLPLTEQTRNGYRVKRNMGVLLRGDAKTRAEVQQIYRQNGVYSVNDILEQEDRENVPGGDTRLASLNYVPLDAFRELSLARNAAPGGGKE